MRGYPYWAACILRRGFCSHRTHRSNGTFLAHVSSPQKASGIQNSQSITANIETNKNQKAAYIRGRGRGRGHHLHWTLCVLFICVNLWEKKVPTMRKNAPCKSWYTKIESVDGVVLTPFHSPSLLNSFILYLHFTPLHSLTSPPLVKNFRFSRTEQTPFMGEGEALQRSRTCPSCMQNMPFLRQERHVLQSNL